MYFVDFQGWDDSFGRKGHLSGKEFVEKMYDPEYVTKRWDALSFWNEWYRKNVNVDAKNEITVKAVYNKMTNEQKEAEEKQDGEFSIYGNYQLECDSWSQSCFEPVKVFCYRSSGEYTVKKIKKIVPKKLHKYLW